MFVRTHFIRSSDRKQQGDGQASCDWPCPATSAAQINRVRVDQSCVAQGEPRLQFQLPPAQLPALRSFIRQCSRGQCAHRHAKRATQPCCQYQPDIGGFAVLDLVEVAFARTHFRGQISQTYVCLLSPRFQQCSKFHEVFSSISLRRREQKLDGANFANPISGIFEFGNSWTLYHARGSPVR
jgi:hypothetical protein